MRVKKGWNRKGLSETKEDLITMAQEKWEQLDWPMIYDMILESMAKCVAEIIKVEGNCTHYELKNSCIFMMVCCAGPSGSAGLSGLHWTVDFGVESALPYQDVHI